MELKVKELDKAYDVVIVGGGPGGCHAAIAAGRLGAKVLLIEEFGYPGGALTAMGVGPMMSFHNRAGQQLIYGTPQEMVDRLVEKGGCPGHIPDSTCYCSTVTPFDAETLKVILDEMLSQAGVQVLYHTRLIDAACTDEKIDSIVIHNAGGLQNLKATVFVDATGNGELAALSGVPFVLGRESDNKTQPMTMNLKIGNVDSVRLREYIKTNWPQFDAPERAGDGGRTLDGTPRVSMWGFYALWQQAKERGEVSVPRDNVLFFETNIPGEYILNTSRIADADPTDPVDLSRAETQGRRQTQEIFGFLHKYVSGFENAVMIGTPPHVGIRESRHPQAVYVLRAEDILSGRRFDHTVVLGGYPIDIHSPDGQNTDTSHLGDDAYYCIPMESLITAQRTNLLLAGRAIGADHHASAAIRVTPIAMATGQAAGAMAWLTATEGRIDYDKLREQLLCADVKLY